MKKLLAIAVLFGGLAEAQWTLPNTTANTSTVGFLDAGLTATGSFKNGASGSTYTNQCDCAQGACQVLASGTSCTCTCSGCTTSSICYSSLIAADGGATNAAEFGGATATCSVGTVTVTLGFTHALASQGNYNVHCNN